VHHQAKTGIYEEFYSANFGAAGRWMTTNLAAWKYDGINHSTDASGTATSGSGTPRTLAGPDVNSGQFNTAYWCYPGPENGNGLLTTIYDNNKQLGLLYTWDAATAGKGGDTGMKNIYNTSGGTSPNDEGNYPEGENPGQQKRIQGICPQGWHLPSDREWNQLEKQIYEHPQLYSSYADAGSFPNGGVWDAAWETTIGRRPDGNPSDGHGTAMKDVCDVNATISNGLSNNLADGGFNVLLAGDAYSGNTHYFGSIAYIWSSSSYSTGNSTIGRSLYYNDNAIVNRYNSGRGSLYSVRCKKD
jgi:uncharacterized protein (TIGR02145 family)